MSERLLYLFDAYLENRLLESERMELQSALRILPEARVAFWDYFEQHALIEDVLSENRGRDLALAEAGIETPDDAPVVNAEKLAGQGAVTSQRSVGWRLGAAALALSLLIALILNAPRNTSENLATAIEGTPAHLVEFTGAAEIVSSEGTATPARVGQQIGAHQTIRTADEESSAVIEYSDHTRITLGAGTTLTVTENSAGSKRVSFGGGSLVADVARQPEGTPLIVAGPQGEMRASDTQFSLASAASESSRLDVARGQGEFVPASCKPVLLDAGNVAWVSADGVEVVVRPMPQTPGSPRAEIEFKGLQSVVFSPDGKTILASTGHQAVLWDGEGRLEAIPLFKDLWDGWRSCWSPDGKVLATTNHRTKEALLWDLAERQVRQTISVAKNVPQEMALAADGQWFAAVDKSTAVARMRLWNGTTGTEQTLEPLDPKIGAFAFSPDGHWLAVGRGDLGKNDKNTLVLINTNTGKPEVVLPVRMKAVGGLTFSPAGQWLAVSLKDEVQIWDVATKKLVRSIRGHERHVRALAFSPDGEYLAGAMHEGPVWVWNANDGTELAVFNVPTPGVRALAFSPDSKSLATVHAKGRYLQLWNVPVPVE